MRAVLDATDTAYYLHLSEPAILELVKLGHIPYKQLGKKLLFLMRDLDTWLDALPGVSVSEAIARIRQAEPTAEAPITLRRAQAGGG